MNFAWLLGFTSFLLGSCLFPITLGVWWEGRYRLSLVRIAVLSALLCVGYFCHLVSLGLTVVGLVVLAVAGPVPCWKRTIMEVSDCAAGAHVDQLRSAVRARLFLSASGTAERTDAAGVGKPVESVVAGRVGGPAGLGRPDHTRDQGRAAVHEPGQPWLRCLRPGALADGWPGVVVVRANDRQAGESHVQTIARMTRTVEKRSATERPTRRPAGLACSGRSASGSEELSDQTPSARPTENSCLSGWCSWA